MRFLSGIAPSEPDEDRALTHLLSCSQEITGDPSDSFFKTPMAKRVYRTHRRANPRELYE